jgi:hypothetical protein
MSRLSIRSFTRFARVALAPTLIALSAQSCLGAFGTGPSRPRASGFHDGSGSNDTRYLLIPCANEADCRRKAVAECGAGDAEMMSLEERKDPWWGRGMGWDWFSDGGKLYVRCAPPERHRRTSAEAPKRQKAPLQEPPLGAGGFKFGDELGIAGMVCSRSGRTWRSWGNGAQGGAQRSPRTRAALSSKL